MLVLGGIPWNCYFQRVLSCQTPAKAQWHSILAGLLTIGFTVPPLLLGVAAFTYQWPADQLAQLAAQPAQALPMIFQHLVPGWVALLGLGAIIGAVTSSFSASILSAGSMIAWNGVYRLWRPDLAPAPALAPDSRGDRRARRRGHRAGARGAERAGALVLHQRPGLRPAVSAVGRSRCSTGARTASGRSRRSACRSCSGSAAGSRCSASRPSIPYPQLLRRPASWDARSSWYDAGRRPAVPVQDAGGCGRPGGAAGRVAADRRGGTRRARCGTSRGDGADAAEGRQAGRGVHATPMSTAPRLVRARLHRAGTRVRGGDLRPDRPRRRRSRSARRSC